VPRHWSSFFGYLDVNAGKLIGELKGGRRTEKEERRARRRRERGGVEELRMGCDRRKRRRSPWREGGRQAGREGGEDVFLSCVCVCVCVCGTFNSMTMSQKVSRSISGLSWGDALVRPRYMRCTSAGDTYRQGIKA
jgi:hypothetical protein